MVVSTFKVSCVAFLLAVFGGWFTAASNNTTMAPPTAKPYNTTYLPTIYVTVKLDMTWTDFCMLDKVFKFKLGSLIFDQYGMAAGADRIVIHNYLDYCAKPTNDKYKKANLILYATKHDGGHQENIDEALTNQIFHKLSYLVETKNQWELGRVFNDEIDEVGIGGDNATPAPEKITEFEHTWIAIAIATALLMLIVIVLVIIHFVKKPKRHSSDEIRYKPRDQEHGAVITRIQAPEPPPASNAAYNYDSSTKL